MKIKNNNKILLLLILDAVSVNLAYIVALLVRFEFVVKDPIFSVYFGHYVKGWLAATIIQLIVFYFGGLYKSLWKYASTEEMMQIIVCCVVSNVMAMAYYIFAGNNLPRSVYIIAGMFCLAFVGGSRFVYRYIRNLRFPGKFNLEERKINQTRIMLVGAGDAGAAMIREIKEHGSQNQRVVVAVDDNKTKVGQRISGVKVAGGRDAIPYLVDYYDIDEIVIAIPTATKKQISEITDICHRTKCKLKILPGLIDLVEGKVSFSALRDVDIEDLLGRDPVNVDLEVISGYLTDKVIMVTGGGGSIGSELCRQIAKYKPRKLTIVDIYENSVYELQQELLHQYPDLELVALIGSVVDRDRMEEIFDRVRPHVVFHAAAHKHVPLMEDAPREAIVNNVIGTNNCMDLAVKYRAGKFILISTDKAVNPTSVMGATKRICEMLMQQHASEPSNTDFAAVRFGNVLGSNGSVIPLFRKQIAAGGPVTVTHKDITRYFMTIPEAVQLVIQAGAMAKGGEIFILDMGEPVKIMDLAEKLIRLSGFEPYKDIDIVVTGLRPGEKLYEELLLSEEGIKETVHDKIFIGHPIPASQGFDDMLSAGIDNTINELIGKTETDVCFWIKSVVPNYQHAQ